MADTSQTLALLALGQARRGDIVRNINRRSALLSLLPVVPGTSQNCAWSVESGGQLTEGFSEGADAANFQSDSQATAMLSWGRKRSNFHVTGTARRAARTASAGPDGVRDLIGRNIVNSSAALASAINVDLFSGNGSTDNIAGLDTAIDDANTYATIDRSSQTYWRSKVVDPGSSTALSFQQMRSDRTAIYVQCGEMPDLCVVSPDLFDTIGSLYDSNRRYVTSLSTPRGQVTLDAGFAALELDGMAIIKDKDATANRIYYLNTNYIELQYQPLEPEMMDMLGLSLQANDGYGATPLGIRCEKLAKNGDSDRYMVFAELQLVLRRPNAFGVRKNVAVAT